MLIGTSKICAPHLSTPPPMCCWWPLPSTQNTLAKALHRPLHPLTRKQFLRKNTQQPKINLTGLNQNFVTNFIANTEKHMPPKSMPFLFTTPVQVYVVLDFLSLSITCKVTHTITIADSNVNIVKGHCKVEHYRMSA